MHRLRVVGLVVRSCLAYLRAHSLLGTQRSLLREYAVAPKASPLLYPHARAEVPSKGRPEPLGCLLRPGP